MENTNNENKWLVQIQKKREEEKGIDESIPVKEKAVHIFLVMLLAVVYYAFFNNKRPGISMIIFTSLSVWVFYSVNKNSINMKNRLGIYALVCLLVICIGSLLHCNSLMEGLNVVAAPMLMTGSFLMFRYPETRWGSWSFLGLVLERIIIIPFRYIGKPFRIIAGLRHSTGPGHKTIRNSILKGLLIGVPTLLAVLALLSSADMMYGYYLSGIGRYIRIENAGDIIGGAVKIFVLFILFFAYLYSFKYNAAANDARKKKTGSFDRVMGITLLVPLVAAYAAFIAIQLFYLFGKEGLPQGLTYAEYARQGFFQLLVVTAINFIIIYWMIYVSRRAEQEMGIVLKWLLSITSLCTFFMLYSSGYKLRLYEQGYGFTYLRFYVHCFIIMLFLLMCIMAAGIWARKINLIKCCLICAVSYYCLLGLVSPDKLIARENINRYNETGKMDTEYLERLSADAVPYIRNFLDENDDSQFNGLRTWLYAKEKEAGEYEWFEMNLPLYQLSKGNQK